ncbi:MAG: hypothetical protein SVR94_17515, partial [Pseudomonadota bacterium]|nr:hypothetical protein [Pseudomonadota bacterium]
PCLTLFETVMQKHEHCRIVIGAKSIVLRSSVMVTHAAQGFDYDAAHQLDDFLSTACKGDI